MSAKTLSFFDKSLVVRRPGRKSTSVQHINARNPDQDSYGKHFRQAGIRIRS